MSGQNNLRATTEPNSTEDSRQLPHDRAVKRQLGFFKQNEPFGFLSLQEGPQEADQPQGPVGKISLGLTGTNGPPMSITGVQVPLADLVRGEFQLIELWNGGLNGLTDLTKSPCAGLHGCACDPVQEVRTVGIVGAVAASLGVANQMRDKMEIAGRPKKVRDFPKIPIRGDLFKARLGQSFRISTVLFGRA